MEQPPRPAQPVPPALGALAALERDVAVLREAWAGALPAWGAVGGPTQVDVEQISDPGLMRVTDALAQVWRDVDVALASVAAEVAKRSGPEFGDVGLAKTQGFHNPVRLIAASTGASRADAARLIAIGAATADRRIFSGERLPSRHPHVAAALRAATIGIEAASAITVMLDRASSRAEPARADVVVAHHIDWWERDTGPTDLSNGVMLCSFCHHRIHRDGWSIHAGPNEVWFIPPPHVDPAQVPRLGGRARFELHEDRAA